MIAPSGAPDFVHVYSLRTFIPEKGMAPKICNKNQYKRSYLKLFVLFGEKCIFPILSDKYPEFDKINS